MSEVFNPKEVEIRQWLHDNKGEHWNRQLSTLENVKRWDDVGAESTECRICGKETYHRGPGY